MSLQESKLRIGVLMPEVLGTYGDSGNAVVLAYRAKMAGYPSEIVSVKVSDAIPCDLDIYTLGGGEDAAQFIASRQLRGDKGLERAVQNNRPVLAICAAMQVLGNWYIDANGKRAAGAELLDVVTLPRAKRAIGELVTEAAVSTVRSAITEPLTGFENHGGATLLGAAAEPLGLVDYGVGNGVPDSSWDIPSGYHSKWNGHSTDGVVQGSIIATYMHGPVLARNPQLADLLLARAIGIDSSELQIPKIPGLERLRSERLAAPGQTVK